MKQVPRVISVPRVLFGPSIMAAGHSWHTHPTYRIATHFESYSAWWGEMYWDVVCYGKTHD